MLGEGYCSQLDLSVSPLVNIITSQMSINKHAHSVPCEPQNICGDLLETTAFKSYAMKHEQKSQYANYSDLAAHFWLVKLSRQRVWLVRLPWSAFSAQCTVQHQRLSSDKNYNILDYAPPLPSHYNIRMLDWSGLLRVQNTTSLKAVSTQIHCHMQWLVHPWSPKTYCILYTLGSISRQCSACATSAACVQL